MDFNEVIKNMYLLEQVNNITSVINGLNESKDYIYQSNFERNATHPNHWFFKDYFSKKTRDETQVIYALIAKDRNLTSNGFKRLYEYAGTDRELKIIILKTAKLRTDPPRQYHLYNPPDVIFRKDEEEFIKKENKLIKKFANELYNDEINEYFYEKSDKFMSIILKDIETIQTKEKFLEKIIDRLSSSEIEVSSKNREQIKLLSDEVYDKYNLTKDELNAKDFITKFFDALKSIIGKDSFSKFVETTSKELSKDIKDVVHGKYTAKVVEGKQESSKNPKINERK